MTKREFYLKSILAMAANPNYVEVTLLPAEKAGEEDCYSRILEVNEIMEDAERLLKHTETVWPDVFDNYSQLGEIDNTLGEVRDAISSQLNVLVEGA